MSPSEQRALSGAIFDESAVLTIQDLSRMCAVDERHIVEFVEEGVLSVVEIEHRVALYRRCAAPRPPRFAAGAGSGTESCRRRARPRIDGRAGTIAPRTQGEAMNVDTLRANPTPSCFFGATGDLAYKKIFPALYAMVHRDGFDIPIIGMARAGWTLDKLKERARDSVEQSGDFDAGCFEKLAALLRYVDGDYADPATFTRLKQALGPAKRPIHYLAIPPSMFASVVQGLAKSRLRRTTRGSSSRSPSAAISRRAQALDRTLHEVFAESVDFSHRPLSGQGGGAEHPVLPLRQYLSRADMESRLHPRRADHHGRRISAFRAAAPSTRKSARSATWCKTICCR